MTTACPITLESFVARLQEAVPEFDSVVAEHLADNDELLIHLLMSDLLRFCEAQFETGDVEVVGRAVEFVNACLQDGDPQVENAVQVSFVEMVGVWRPTTAFVESWPPGLLAERERQRRA